MSGSSGESGDRANDNPEIGAGAPPGATSPDETSGLDELSSLKTYFGDRVSAPSLAPFSDWLRGKANLILKDEAGAPEDLFKFAKNWLKEKLLFGPAAKILALALTKCGAGDIALANRIRQQQALATYKDEETPPRTRYRQALLILEKVQPLSGVDPDKARADQAETWALRGAVHRRMFDLDGDMSKLHQALFCYRKTDEFDCAREIHNFEGYGALNAAFLLDSLAFRFESIGKGPILRDAAQAARNESAALRREIVRRLRERLADDAQAQQEWLCDTLACACHALALSKWTHERGDVEALLNEARSWTEKGAASKRAEWARETTHAQWLRVAYLNEPTTPDAQEFKAYWDAAASVINIFRENNGGAASTPGIQLDGLQMARNARLGKVGLALSGGGFRASYYHIGVLARLAEADVLRHVDVLSTVSGGSIVGAHYYLKLQKLLQTKANPNCADYVNLIEELKQEFSAGVNKNLRMLGLSDWGIMVKLLSKCGYTRSDRMAELYDEHFYSPLVDEKARPVRMESLRIHPMGDEANFNPRFSNWRRSARVPALLINATCLNTGHSWHFTANWMGEPPELIGEAVDKNERLRRVPYGKAGPYDKLTLGAAVAASACVPGIFEPLQLPGLYPGRLVRLVDGGVHDNQGVDALIGQGCDFIFCSDASGQMGDENIPPNGPVSTPSRSMSVLMKRVREGEYADLSARAATPDAGRNLFFVHLKSELPADAVDWVGCEDPTPPTPRAAAVYGVDNQIQRYISDIRTDLNSFSEVEASALMTSGYLMASHELKRCVDRLGAGRGNGGFAAFDLGATPRNWDFLALKNKMALPPDTNDIVREDLCRQLIAGHRLFLRNVFLAPPWLLTVGAFMALALVVLVIALACNHLPAIGAWLDGGGWRFSYVVIVIAAVAALAAIFSSRFRVWCFESFFALFGFLGSNFYLRLGLNELLLRRGELKRLLDLK